ncbi:MAG: methyl-accepting chemotaxis protein [Methylomonas sp.]|jgi:methyl-accepting chemotaxis protein
MTSKSSEVAQLKRNIFIQLATIGLLPLVALIFITLRIGAMADGIHAATSTETLARSGRAHYKSFVEGVLEAVDVGMLSSKAMTHLESAGNDLEDLIRNGQNSQELETLYNNIQTQSAALHKDNSITALMGLRQGVNQANVALEKITRRLEEESGKQITSLISTSVSLRYALFALTTAMLLIWALVVRYLLKRLTIPLETAIGVCKAIANGQLADKNKNARADTDIGGLIANINAMRYKWTEVVYALRGHTQTLWQSSRNLTSQVVELDENAQRQSKSAGYIAQTIEEMSANMDVIARQANEASRHAETGGNLATLSKEGIGKVSAEIEQVAEIIHRAANSVSNLDAKAAGIGGIITLISGLADQTNLLALNAAIEAARAGEAGRGFAVVADEVRKLADQTNVSTQSIAAMITEIKSATKNIVLSMQASVDRVRNSVELSRELAERISEVQTMSSSISVAIDDVDRALQLQRKAALEIEKKILSIANSAENHASSGKTVSESAKSIESAASAISANVSYFKIE